MALVQGDVRRRFATSSTVFPGSLAPTLPGHGAGASCASVERYTEWVRGWLWAQGQHHDLVLVGYRLGACIALQYGLDYPEEVSDLVLMTCGHAPEISGRRQCRYAVASRRGAGSVRAVDRPMQESMRFVAPEFREHLIACHHQIGPRSQHHDLVVIDQFDVRHRVSTLIPPLLLIRGVDDPLVLEEYEREIHEAVPGSQYLTLREVGHFPMAEQPAAVNRAIATFLDTLGASQTNSKRGAQAYGLIMSTPPRTAFVVPLPSICEQPAGSSRTRPRPGC